MAISEARKRAKKKYEEKNREKTRRDTYRRSARMFIKNYADTKDIEEFEQLIKIRKNEISL